MSSSGLQTQVYFFFFSKSCKAMKLFQMIDFNTTEHIFPEGFERFSPVFTLLLNVWRIQEIVVTLVEISSASSASLAASRQLPWTVSFSSFHQFWRNVIFLLLHTFPPLLVSCVPFSQLVDLYNPYGNEGFGYRMRKSNCQWKPTEEAGL